MTNLSDLKPGDLFRIDSTLQAGIVLSGNDGILCVTPEPGLCRVIENGPNGLRYERVDEHAKTHECRDFSNQREDWMPPR